MRTLILTAAALAFACTTVLAAEGKKLSEREVKNIKTALSSVGCDGGDYVKEPSGLFEIDDAKCKIGQYDVKLDKDFNITLMSRNRCAAPLNRNVMALRALMAPVPVILLVSGEVALS